MTAPRCLALPEEGQPGVRGLFKVLAILRLVSVCGFIFIFIFIFLNQPDATPVNQATETGYR
jgi:hypothetical protein